MYQLETIGETPVGVFYLKGLGAPPFFKKMIQTKQQPVSLLLFITVPLPAWEGLGPGPSGCHGVRI